MHMRIMDRPPTPSATRSGTRSVGARREPASSSTGTREFWGVRDRRVVERAPGRRRRRRVGATRTTVDVPLLPRAGGRPGAAHARRGGRLPADGRPRRARRAAASGEPLAAPSTAHATPTPTALRAIARASHGDTRFYADPHFPDERCDDLYDTWIRRSLEGWADAVLVAERRRSAARLRLVPPPTTSTGSIGLIARRRGGARARRRRATLVRAARRVVRRAPGSTRMHRRHAGPERRRAALFQRCGFRTVGRRPLVPQVVSTVTELADPVQPGEPRRRTSSTTSPRRSRTGTSPATGRSRAAARSCSSSELGVPRVLLTTSCTHALEMAALLLDLGPGDEVIVPSFTFVSTRERVRAARRAARLRRRPAGHAQPRRAPARRRRHAADARDRARRTTPASAARWTRSATLARRAASRSSRTTRTASSGSYRGRPLGTFGALATQSFHETKNVTCGEGGALARQRRRATSSAPRSSARRGRTGSGSSAARSTSTRWVDVGSSYVPSRPARGVPVRAARGSATRIQAARRGSWERYDEALARLGRGAGARLPIVPAHCEQPYHMFYLLLPSLDARDAADRAPRASAGSSPSSTTCRCTCRRWAGASAAARGSARSPRTWPTGCSGCRSTPHDASRSRHEVIEAVLAFRRVTDRASTRALRAARRRRGAELLVPRAQPADRLDAAAPLPRRALVPRGRLRDRASCSPALRDAFPTLRLVGGELYEEGLAIARARLPDVELVELDARDCRTRASSTSSARSTCSSTSTRTSRCSRSMVRAARPGGGVLLLVPQHPWLWSEHDEFVEHRRRYTRKELVAKAERAGIEVARGDVVRHVAAAGDGRLAARRPHRASGPTRSRTSSRAPLNGVFERMLDGERRLIERGVSLPFGGSLMLVGRKPQLP